jgi:uncharacterized protein
MTVGTAVAKRGKVAYGELQVPAGVDSGYRIGVAVIHGARPGKTIAFVSGAHGTEYASVVAASRLIAKIDPDKLSGAVIVVPLVNVASFEQMIVHVNPIDRKGMNGGFPGQQDGTQTQRAVAMIAEQVVAPADYVVDLHGGDLDEDLRPYSYWTRIGDTAKDAVMRSMVLAFGIDHIIVRDAEVGSAGRTLGGYALDKGKLSIVAEAGRSGLVLDEDVSTLVEGCLNVLGTLGMIDRKVKPVAKPVYITAGTRVAADKVGMWFPMVARDKRVSQGQVVGYTTDFLGRRTGEVKSPVAGLVTFIRTVPSMPMRATLVNVSEILPGAPPWEKPKQ